MFIDLNQPNPKTGKTMMVYSHYTQATDTENVKIVFAAVKGQFKVARIHDFVPKSPLSGAILTSAIIVSDSEGGLLKNK